MIIDNRQRITQTSGLIQYDTTPQEALLFFDTGSDITDPIEIAFPSDPIEGQLIGLTTRKLISDMTLSSQYYPITAPVTSLSPDSPKLWFFSTEANRWLMHP